MTIDMREAAERLRELHDHDQKIRRLERDIHDGPARLGGLEGKVAEIEKKIRAVDERVITLDGARVADTQTQGQSAQVDRIEPLIQGLEAEKRKWETIHPSEPFAGQVIVQADRNIDFRVVKKVMFSAAAAGYGNVSFAVNQAE